MLGCVCWCRRFSLAVGNCDNLCDHMLLCIPEEKNQKVKKCIKIETHRISLI